MNYQSEFCAAVRALHRLKQCKEGTHLLSIDTDYCILDEDSDELDSYSLTDGICTEALIDGLIVWWTARYNRYKEGLERNDINTLELETRTINRLIDDDAESYAQKHECYDCGTYPCRCEECADCGHDVSCCECEPVEAEAVEKTLEEQIEDMLI
jgi:hypothetical protein